MPVTVNINSDSSSDRFWWQNNSCDSGDRITGIVLRNCFTDEEKGTDYFHFRSARGHKDLKWQLKEDLWLWVIRGGGSFGSLWHRPLLGQRLSIQFERAVGLNLVSVFLLRSERREKKKSLARRRLRAKSGGIRPRLAARRAPSVTSFAQRWRQWPEWVLWPANWCSGPRRAALLPRQGGSRQASGACVLWHWHAVHYIISRHR